MDFPLVLPLLMLKTNVFSANNKIKRGIYPATKTFILKHNSKAHFNSMWRLYQGPEQLFCTVTFSVLFITCNLVFP